MVASQTTTRKSEAEMPVDFDAVVIGAGVSGLYQLYRLRELGLTVRVFEAGTAVAALGTGTATPAPGSIPKAGPTAIRSRRNCSTNGTGRSISPASPRPSVT